MKNTVARLVRYFTEGIGAYTTGTMIGIEVETQFVDRSGLPISIDTAKKIFHLFHSDTRYGEWVVTAKRNKMITELTSLWRNDRMLYELGRHNIELSFSPKHKNVAVDEAQRGLWILEENANACGAYPFFGPIIDSDENLLVVPDERDAAWLALDGPEALNLLARTSSVQFTVDVRPEDAIYVLNTLGENVEAFLSDYPQDALWKRYISSSHAGYRSDRYGGPLLFGNIEDYCARLAEHAIVVGNTLISHEETSSFNIPLFIRSVWWHFRLKRYGEKLCVEIRPCARKKDSSIKDQFSFVRRILSPLI